MHRMLNTGLMIRISYQWMTKIPKLSLLVAKLSYSTVGNALFYHQTKRKPNAYSNVINQFFGSNTLT